LEEGEEGYDEDRGEEVVAWIEAPEDEGEEDDAEDLPPYGGGRCDPEEDDEG